MSYLAPTSSGYHGNSGRAKFCGSFGGNTQLVFPTESAATLVEVLTGEESESPVLDELKILTLTEVGNIVINGVMGSIGNVLNQPIHRTFRTLQMKHNRLSQKWLILPDFHCHIPKLF